NITIFLVSGVAKIVGLVAAGAILFPVALAGGRVIAIVVFLLVAFSLTVIDTLIRADAVELLGVDLIGTTGIVGVLLAFETMVAASFVIVVITGFVNSARLLDVLFSLAAAVVISIFLTLLHSYLLLVRFSAIDVMRRTSYGSSDC